MRLLVLTNNPDRASFRQRIGIHLPLLQERGVRPEIAVLPGGSFARQKLFRHAAEFDGLLLHRKMLNAWDGYWLRRSARRVIYDFDDAIMYSDRKPEQVSRLRFRRFARSVALSRLVIAGNAYLADHARQYSDCVRVLPTSLDMEPYRAPPPKADDGNVRLVWIGSRSTLKYLREIAPALEEVAGRCGDAVLRIICNEFLDLKIMRVEKRTWSRGTEAADLATSDIGLAPLPDNAFTRGKCGFKILQYQAARLPVVASPVGVNAEYVQPGVTGFHAITASEWVDTLTRLIRDCGLRAQMGEEGATHAQGFDARIIGRRWAEWIVACLETPMP